MSLRGFTNRKGIVGVPNAVHPVTGWIFEYAHDPQPVTPEIAADAPREHVDDHQDAYYAVRRAPGYYKLRGGIDSPRVRITYATRDGTRAFVRDYRAIDQDGFSADTPVYGVVARPTDFGTDVTDLDVAFGATVHECYPDATQGGAD